MDETNTRTPKSRPETDRPGPHRSGREHLADELLKLDALIYLQVLRFRDVNGNRTSDESRGLYVTDDEVDAILSAEPAGRENDGSSARRSEIETLRDYVENLRTTLSDRIEMSTKLGIKLPLCHLSHLFHLTPLELDTILICLAPEVDSKYGKFYAYLQDDITKKHPCVNLILDILCSTSEQRWDVRPFFNVQAPLLKYSLVEFDGDIQEESFLSRRLKINDRVADFLLGSDLLDSRISSLAELIYPERDWSAVIMPDGLKRKFSQFSKQLLSEEMTKSLIFCLHGTHGSGKKLAAEAFCRDFGLPLMIVDTRDLLNSEINFGEAIRLLFRETLLQPAAIYLEHVDGFATGESGNIRRQNVLARAIEDFSFITFLAGEKQWDPYALVRKNRFVEVRFPTPSYPLRRRLWKLLLDSQHAVSADANISVLANKFRFTGGQIQDAVARAESLARMRGGNGDAEITMQDLYESCRARSNQRLSVMAQKLVPLCTWADIVLPPDKLQQLKEISNYVKHRTVVYEDWGFGRKLSIGKGLNVLFSGPSGTGKTMAAGIMANELNLDLYKIDLSCIVSKYIGETEKNLATIFKEAEASNAILFFDEADAIFGKRSEVRDSHDRYANIEINYLLQRMEEHEGIAVLASNFRKNIDEAFTRRMHFSVDFPFPDASYRLQIWQNIFPTETPVSGDMDFEFLARKLKISGGNIKNIALNAAFLAAEKAKVVNMEHIVWAARREFQKMGKLCVRSDFGEYYDLVVPARESEKRRSLVAKSDVKSTKNRIVHMKS